MQFTDEHRFDFPIEVVRKAYFDAVFAPTKYAALGLTNIVVEDSGHADNQFFVAVSFEMKPTIQVPRFAQKFIGQGVTVGVKQTDRWDTLKNTGTLDVEIDGLSHIGRIHCDMTLATDGNQTVNTMVWNIDVQLPLIGNKLAAVLAEDIQQKSAADCAATVDILADYAKAASA